MQPAFLPGRPQPETAAQGVIEKNILRLGLMELEAGATPAPVVIDEALRLAHWFAGDKAPPFVNGVLDTLARRLGRL